MHQDPSIHDVRFPSVLEGFPERRVGLPQGVESHSWVEVSELLLYERVPPLEEWEDTAPPDEE